MTLVPITPSTCTDCLTALYEVATAQPALFRHGGHGATITTVVSWCPTCGYEGASSRSETRPEAVA